MIAEPPVHWMKRLVASPGGTALCLRITALLVTGEDGRDAQLDRFVHFLKNQDTLAFFPRKCDTFWLRTDGLALQDNP